MQSPQKVPVMFDSELFGYKKEQVDSYVGNLSNAYREVFDALAGLCPEERNEREPNKQAPSEKMPDLQKTIEDFYAEALGSGRSASYLGAAGRQN